MSFPLHLLFLDLLELFTHLVDLFLCKNILSFLENLDFFLLDMMLHVFFYLVTFVNQLSSLGSIASISSNILLTFSCSLVACSIFAFVTSFFLSGT